MKPSKEQIEAWVHESQCIRQIGFILREDGESPAEPWIGFVANRPQVEAAVELAYAAGRKAGMEEAKWACLKVVARNPMQPVQMATECIREIVAAMEDDK